MAASSSRSSAAMERTGQWVFSQEISTDIVVEVGKVHFPLHKFMLVAKSGYVRRKVLESDDSDLTHIDLSGVPGGAEAFERAAKFCYGVNFEISVYNVAVLRCAAEYLEMTDRHCEGNLAGRAEEFLAQAALKTLPGAVIVLRSCEGLLPMADEIGIVQTCVDTIGSKARNESNLPTRSPPEWWAAELVTLSPSFFQKILTAMRACGASPKALACAVSAYAEKSLSNLVPRPGSTTVSSNPTADARSRLESIVSLLPADRDAPLPAGFLCCLLRAAIFIDASSASRRELERRISTVLEQVAVGDLLAVALDYSGQRVADLDSVRSILSMFVEKEASGGGVFYGGGAVCCSATMQKVAKTVDSFMSEIATDEDLSVSKFAGIAGALPKSARRFDDDLYRAVDIFLKVHPGLDEIGREKVCSVMDPLKLSYEARLHASQNKRLPLQIVLHALYFDQLKLRSGGVAEEPAGVVARAPVGSDAELIRENEALRSELATMRMHMSNLQRGQGSAAAASTKVVKKPTFFSSVSRTLGKLISFKQGSKDTSSIADEMKLDVTKPRKRRFSIS